MTQNVSSTNDLLLRVLDGKSVPRPPVWMMRQAGRYLPEFRALRERYDFFTRCETPELAAEITVQPVDQIGVDAAILFSDILVVPRAMNLPFKMRPEGGPYLEQPPRDERALKEIIVPEIKERLNYVLEAITHTKELLRGRVPLIGFAGAPWTIFCYVIEGHGSKDFTLAKTFCWEKPHLAHELLSKITKTTISYLKAQIAAGVDAVQLFDSWAGVLGPEDYGEFSLPYIKEIVMALGPDSRTIVFAKGGHFALSALAELPLRALGLDWTIAPEIARREVGDKVLQGNFDPALLLGPRELIVKRTEEMLQSFGKERYIANLGHGILPQTPVDSARAFVDTVKKSGT